MKNLEKPLIFLFIFLAAFPLAKIVYRQWDYYRSPFDLQLMEESYGRSQYVREEPLGWLPDEFLFAYAGWDYINGGSPIIINPENPPLGKYLIGLSIKFFNNEKLLTLLFAFLSLFSLFLLGKLFLKKAWLALLPVMIFSWGQLFQEQLLYLPLFEVFSLVFLNLAIYFFIRAQEKDQYFFLSSFFLGTLWATRPWMATVPLIIAWLAYIVLVGDKRKLFSWLISLSVAPVVLLLTYLRLFQEGWSFYKVLSVQKWILWYHQSRLIKFGSVWPFIYLKRWYVWWGNEPYQIVNQWNIFWPIFTTLALLFSVLVFIKTFKKKWLKAFKFDRRIMVLSLWLVFYLIFLSIGNINSRYVFYLLPYCYLLGTYFLVGIYQRKTTGKIEVNEG